ncbi:sarcosine oxidase subunit gamma [Yoonia maricola]|uniref:Sarcosine oxidase subunit gamma n=1 Tax=Yoonia maricola TaxID=420999 RepID=A0A2M8WNE7_9RHOB|nr:sarcosine oxidase subunit gamma [Yoonia maricola]PJI92457.1 sarcosine oxidase subunit gamma [Yoonia maricola]
MAKLIALTPCAGLLPVSSGGVEVAEVVFDRLMSVSPFAGQERAVSAKLKEQVGAGLSKINRRSGLVTWFGHGTWIVAGDVALGGMAAVTDQSDAWAAVSISGARATDVLARLVPIDLGASGFKTNHVAKTMLGHMSVTITRVGPDAFEIIVMRSMARTLVHDLDVAMRGVAAR